MTDQKMKRYTNGGATESDILYSSAALYAIPRDEVRGMFEEGNLDKFEEYLCQVEATIFGSGPFSARKIEENLQLLLSSETLAASQKKNIDMLRNSPFRDAVADAFKKLGMSHIADEVETGQRSRPETVSLSEKKSGYEEVFDGMSEIITAVKDRLKTMQGKTSENDRIVSLLERYEKCEDEIHKIRSIMAKFL